MRTITGVAVTSVDWGTGVNPTPSALNKMNGGPGSLYWRQNVTKEKLWQQSLPTTQITRQESYRIKNLFFFFPKKTEYGVCWVCIKPRTTGFSNGATLLSHKVYSWIRHLRIEMLALNLCVKNILMSQIFPLCRAFHSATLIVSGSFLPKKGLGYLSSCWSSRYHYSQFYISLLNLNQSFFKHITNFMCGIYLINHLIIFTNEWP